MKDKKYIRIRKRKYGLALLVDIPFVDDSGTTQHYSRTIKVIDFPSEKAAWSAARKIRDDALHDIESGKLRKKIPTVKTIYEQRWLVLPLSLKSRERADNIYRHSIRQYENTPLSDISVAQIQKTLNDRAEKYPANSVQRVLTLWRSLYKTAAVLGYDIQDKTNGVVLPKSKVVHPPRNVQISSADFFRFCDALLMYNAAEDIQHNNIAIWYALQIMYYTGCRTAEAFALTRSDIFDDHISINKSVGSTQTKKKQIIPTKTKTSVRNIPIVQDLKPVLESLLQWAGSEQLLLDEHGELFEINYVSNLIHLVSKKSGIHFTAYMLRHKMSTDLLHAGNSVVARDLLGHSSFGMTLDYARSTQEQILSALTAERQPKSNRHRMPQETIQRQYQIFRFVAVLRIVCIIKGFSQRSVKRQ